MHRSLTGLIILCSLVLLTVLLWIVATSFTVIVMRGLAMLTLPGLSVYFVISRCRVLSLSNGNRSVSSVFFYSLFITLLTGVIAIFSAHLARAIDLSVTWNISPLLKAAVYIVTVLYSCIVLFRLLYLEKGASFADYMASIYFSITKNKARAVAIGLVILTAILLWILVINTSDNSISSTLNSFLSNIFAVYPPSSQYLIGYPSISAALVLCSRRMRAGAWPFVLLSSIIGITAMLSTVSAIVPMRHTFGSMALGLGLGLIISLLVDLAFSLIIRALKLRSSHNWRINDEYDMF